MRLKKLKTEIEKMKLADREERKKRPKVKVPHKPPSYTRKTYGAKEKAYVNSAASPDKALGESEPEEEEEEQIIEIPAGEIYEEEAAEEEYYSSEHPYASADDPSVAAHLKHPFDGEDNADNSPPRSGRRPYEADDDAENAPAENTEYDEDDYEDVSPPSEEYDDDSGEDDEEVSRENLDKPYDTEENASEESYLPAERSHPF
jgi:hypothetical protein